MQHSRALDALLVIPAGAAVAGCKQAPAEDVAAASLALAEGDTVYESLSQISSEGDVVSSSEVGSLTLGELQLVGRPWTHYDEPYLYHEIAWAQSQPDGTVQHGYRVSRTPHNPITKPLTSAKPEVDPNLLAAAAAQPADKPVRVIANLRNYPDWDIPLMPGMALGVDDLAAVAAEREKAIADRKALYHAMAADVVGLIEKAGGATYGSGWGSGWIVADVPASLVPVLAERNDFLWLGRHDVVAREGAWYLGEGRWDSRLHSVRFYDAGYTGEASNSTRHSFGDITVGVNEIGGLEDEACFLYDGSSCSGASRLKARYRCDNVSPDYCQLTANFPDQDEGRHGTLTTSIVLADYTQGQGDAWALGDSSWTADAGHSATWKERASGMAREAGLVYFGASSPPDYPGLVDAIDEAIAAKVDILNNSWSVREEPPSSYNYTCNPLALMAAEQEAENAFDDGVLYVGITGNNDVTPGSAPSSPRTTSPRC